MEAACTKQRLCMKLPPFLVKVSVWKFFSYTYMVRKFNQLISKKMEAA